MKPEYTSLCVFGCSCWPNLRPYNQHKLVFRSKECAFLGYSNLHKGFKCLDISTGRVYISRDVVFDENVFPFSKLHSNAGARLRSEILLLPPSLLNSSVGEQTVDDHIFNDACNNVSSTQSGAMQQNAGSGAHSEGDLPGFLRTSTSGSVPTGDSTDPDTPEMLPTDQHPAPVNPPPA